MGKCDGHVAATAFCLSRFLRGGSHRQTGSQLRGVSKIQMGLRHREASFGCRHGTLIGEVWRKVTSIGSEALAQLLAFAQSSVDSNYGIVKKRQKRVGWGK